MLLMGRPRQQVGPVEGNVGLAVDRAHVHVHPGGADDVGLEVVEHAVDELAAGWRMGGGNAE